MRRAGRGHPTSRIKLGEGERMPGPCGQLRQIEKLGPPVPLAEGMNIVHVAHDPSGRRGEVRPVQAMQEGGAGKALVNVLQPGFDEPAKLELMPALGNLHIRSSPAQS